MKHTSKIILSVLIVVTLLIGVMSFSASAEELPVLEQTDSFSFTSEEGYNSAVASGKLGFTGSFRNNGGSFQFGDGASIEFIIPANTTVTVEGHSAQYGVFSIELNGAPAEIEPANGVYKFTVTEQTTVKIGVGANGASYSYIKAISLEKYINRTITSDTIINFGSQGNYKDSIVDFSGIQIGDNGGNNSQVKNGSFDLLLKAGSIVKIHGYPGYTSYQLNGGAEIKDEYYTYTAAEDMTLTVTPVNGNNYFYSIEITVPEVEAPTPEVDVTVAFLGAGVRYSKANGEYEDPAMVSIRFGYEFSDISKVKAWGWTYSANGKTLTAEGKYAEGNVTNLVLTNIPTEYLNAEITVTLWYTVEVDGVDVTVTDDGNTRATASVLAETVARDANANAVAYAKAALYLAGNEDYKAEYDAWIGKNN